MTKIEFLNIEIDNLSFAEALKRADELVYNEGFDYIVTPNIDHIVQVEENCLLKEAYKNASLVLTDGKPLIWISKYLKTPIKEKISGSDFFPELTRLAAKKKYRIFLLGAQEGVAKIAKEKLEKKFPGLIISGFYSPPFGFEKSEVELSYIYKMINDSNSDILAVGLGAPKQELFLYNCFKSNCLKVPLAIGVGATIDFEAGVISRAPKWMSNNGLEWAYRLIKEPRRMYKRYWNDLISIGPIIRKYGNGHRGEKSSW